MPGSKPTQSEPEDPPALQPSDAPALATGTRATEELLEYIASRILPPAENAPELRSSKWSKAAATAALEAAPKLPVYIPLDFDEQQRPGPFFASVIWNGWEWRLEKGVQTMAPEPIALIIYQSLEKARTQQFLSQRPWDCLISGGGRTIRGETFGGKQIVGG